MHIVLQYARIFKLSIILLLISAVYSTTITTDDLENHRFLDAKHGEKAHWVNADAITIGSFTDWSEEKQFCLYTNTSINVRMDKLNSSLQPYIIQWVAKAPEASNIYNSVVKGFANLQSYARPMSTFLFAWSKLRVVVESANVLDLTFFYNRSPGLVCRGVLHVAKLTEHLQPYISLAALHSVQQTLQHIAKFFCETCVHGCPLVCTPLSATTCFLELSPYHSPCVTVTAPARSVMSISPSNVQFSIAFYTVLSLVYIQRLVLGFIMYYTSEKLSRSRLFHYLLAAFIGISFSAMLALYFISRQTKAASRIIPGVETLQQFGSIVSLIVPFTSFVLREWVFAAIAWSFDCLWYIWASESFLGIPHLGKLYFLLFGLLSCGIVWWNQWGVYVQSEEERRENEQTQEEIDEIGYLEVELPTTTFERLLGRTLRLLALVLLFYSSSSNELSVILVLLVSISNVFSFVWHVVYFWYHYERPGRHTMLLSKKEFDKQGETETAKALKKLQAHIALNPSVLDLVKEENEVRMRRFGKGRYQEDDFISTERKRRAKANSWISMCTIQ